MRGTTGKYKTDDGLSSDSDESSLFDYDNDSEESNKIIME